MGVFTGYSSINLALALPDDGKLIACDVEETTTAIAQRYWKEAGVDHKVELHLRPAIQTLDWLIEEGHSGSFDLVFIDADKPSYDAYFERAMVLLRTGGAIIIDNVLWHGAIVENQPGDESLVALQNLNRKLATDERIHVTLVPLGDGMTLARKR